MDGVSDSKGGLRNQFLAEVYRLNDMLGIVTCFVAIWRIQSKIVVQWLARSWTA